MYTKDDLLGLDEPSRFRGDVSLAGQLRSNVSGYVRSMMLIRKVEDRLASARRNGDIGGPVHLGVGQEAIAVGVSSSLTTSDYVFGGHRSHAHLLALGADVRKLFAETLGRATGHSKGMGGSMHLWDEKVGFYGAVPIVAGTVALAAGAALASKLQNRTDVAVAYLGDGAVEEGVVHESLNLARLLDLPILFVVENNLFASHMHISQRQPSGSTSRFAQAHRIPFELVDGNDVVALAETAKEMVGRLRMGHGPGFLEAVTFRWYGHVDWRDDLDVGVHRSEEEVSEWRQRDPIKRLTRSMEKIKWWSNERGTLVEAELDEIVQRAWDQAIKDPYPETASILDYVYKK